jgi:hypothetical protein
MTQNRDGDPDSVPLAPGTILSTGVLSLFVAEKLPSLIAAFASSCEPLSWQLRETSRFT